MAFKRLKAVTLGLVFYFFIVIQSFSQELSNIPGAFAEAGFGVRPSAMGQAYTALSNDANAFLTNPAGLLIANRANFTASYSKLFGIVPSSYLGILYPLGKTYAIGGGFLFVGDDALSEYTMGLSFAFTFPNVPVGGNEIYFDQMSFGITIKVRRSSFGNNADGGENRVTGSGSGIAMDLGYIIYTNQHLSLGVVIRDLLNRFRWDSSVSGKYTESIPATLRFGGAYNLNGLTIAFDLRKALHTDTSNRFYIGAEMIPIPSVVLRAGFSNNLGTADLNRRWSFGLGLVKGITENYTVAINAAYRIGNIENLLRFGLDVYWGTSKIRPKGRVY